jgi:Pup amidohydrolase
MRILAGLETEYGLYIEGRGAAEQIEDSQALVRNDPSRGRFLWDYRYESPRADLRGFSVEKLAVDPVDAQYRRSGVAEFSPETRADRLLPNGARFYNDHGHPEYATPECFTLAALAIHDEAGELHVQRAAEAFEAKIGRPVRVYKNNTDFHGSSYGTHESYLCPRELGFDRLYAAVMPMLIARTILCGAGKIGTERSGVRGIRYQLSARADFFSEAFNVETLYRRPIFNTRDEPHADPAKWIRLHVIAGDANMMPVATRRKVGLLKLAIGLASIGKAPRWRIQDPVRAMLSISADDSQEFSIELEGREKTSAYEILESYFEAGWSLPHLDDEMEALLLEGRELCRTLRSDWRQMVPSVDWAAKRWLLEQVMSETGLDWSDPDLRSYELEYHSTDRENGLFYALREMGRVPNGATEDELEAAQERSLEPTRARIRGAAIDDPELANASWEALEFDRPGGRERVLLDPMAEYPDAP